MTDTTFQDRMQRIQATQGDAFERDYPDYSQTGRRIPTKVAKAERGPFWGIALMPMMLLVGFASVVVPRVLMHHYVSGPSLLLSNGQSSAVGIYGDRGDERLEEGAARGDGWLADLCDEWERAADEAPEGVWMER